jgi:hypothetical protein
LEHEGCELYGHEQKAAALHGFYLGLLGTNVATTWAFSLNSLYPEGPAPLTSLDDNFAFDEILKAIRSMHSLAVPGLMDLAHTFSNIRGL